MIARDSPRLSIPDSRVFQSHWPKAQRKPTPAAASKCYVWLRSVAAYVLSGVHCRANRNDRSPRGTGSEQGLLGSGPFSLHAPACQRRLRAGTEINTKLLGEKTMVTGSRLKTFGFHLSFAAACSLIVLQGCEKPQT